MSNDSLQSDHSKIEYQLTPRDAEYKANVKELSKKIIGVSQTLTIDTLKISSAASILGQSAAQLAGATLKDVTISSATTAISNAKSVVGALVSDEVMNIVSSISSVMSFKMMELTPPPSFFLENFKKIDFSPLFKNIQTFGKQWLELTLNNHVKLLYNEHWYPSIGLEDHDLMYQIMDICCHTIAGSKSRTKKIDKAIYEFYNKTRLENIRLQWNHRIEEPYMRKIFRETVKAYYRKEYALTLSTFVTMWQGIIAEKVNDDNWRTNAKMRENFRILVQGEKFGESFINYFEKEILYDCYKKEEFKDDTPGRNGVAHGFYNRYPSQKAALNAILFTDFLIRLEPIEAEQFVA